MTKVFVEFINTCPCCDQYGELIQRMAKEQQGKIDYKIYHAGKDLDYLRKYGNVTQGTLIVNEERKYQNLTKNVVEKAILEALGNE